MTPDVESFRGCLLGGALGDALAYGKPAEHGDDAPFDLARENPAPISCMTQQTLFTAEGLLRGQRRIEQRGFGDPVDSVSRALLRWADTQGEPAERELFDRGWLVDEPLLRAARTLDPTWAAVVRAAPCGLAARSAEIAFSLARDTAALTHRDAASYLGAGYFATVLWHLIRGKALPDAMTASDAVLVAQRSTEMLHVRHGDGPLALAFACAHAVDRHQPRAFEQAVWRAARQSEAAACLTGSLLGATPGHGALPTLWLQQLELRDVIDRIATDLYGAMIAGRTSRAYPPN